MGAIRWRVGAKVPRNVYRGDEPIFVAPDEATARGVVDAVNAVEPLARALRVLGKCPYCHAGSYREASLIPGDGVAMQAYPCVSCQGTGLVEAARTALHVLD